MNRALAGGLCEVNVMRQGLCAGADVSGGGKTFGSQARGDREGDNAVLDGIVCGGA